MLNVPTVMLQWASGGLLFLWITTRRREVGLGYGWLMRGTFAAMAIISVLTCSGSNSPGVLLVGAVGVSVVTLCVLASSIIRKSAGVSGQNEAQYARSQRVAAMTGIERNVATVETVGKEFQPNLDLIAPIIGLLALLISGLVVDDGGLVLALRLVVSALFLGSITDAMLLGHWYLVQPGLKRDALHELIKWFGYVWPAEVFVLLLPTGMISAFNGSIDDGYSGLLTYFWAVCAVTTIGLVFVTRLALREKQYSAVMAATGLTYLAILTAFGTDLVARAILS